MVELWTMKMRALFGPEAYPTVKFNMQIFPETRSCLSIAHSLDFNDLSTNAASKLGNYDYI